MPTEYYRKNKEKLHVNKEACERYQNRSGKKKIENMVASDIKIFLKKENKRSVSINVNVTKIILKIKNKE